MGKLVGYYRVSTARQGASGLGLEAQQAAVAAYTRRGDTVVAGFTEVESGKRNDRPELGKAIEACHAYGAKLVIAKLDRLARNVAFIAAMMDSAVEFVACDFPQANRLTLHILAAVAEHEREMISTRTKEALAAAKQRGVRLGNPNGARCLARAGRGNAASIAAARRRADERARALRPIVEVMQAEGHVTLRALATELNRRGIKTPRGGEWHPASVKRLLRRLDVPKSVARPNRFLWQAGDLKELGSNADC